MRHTHKVRFLGHSDGLDLRQGGRQSMENDLGLSNRDSVICLAVSTAR